MLTDLLKNGACNFRIELNDNMIEQFMEYMKLLKEWNEKINLTSIVEDEEIIKKHFLDSLSLFEKGIIKDGMNLIDVGTGAGFPGIPIKIANPKVNVVLLDSLNKRINFLNEVILKLGLKGIKAVHGRAEDFAREEDFREKFDIATARAVASLPVLAEYCLPFVKIGGYFLAMKGPNIEDELKNSSKAVDILGGRMIDVVDVNIIEENVKHKIILIQKIRGIDKKYPRKAGKVEKNPLI